MRTSQSFQIFAPVVGAVLIGAVAAFLPPAELGAVEAMPKGLNMQQTVAAAPINLPTYDDTYQHYGLLDPVRP